MLGRVVSMVLAAALLAACGSSGSSVVDTPSTVAACDWTAVATTTATVSHPRACQQVVGPVAEIEASKPGCTASSPAAVVRTTCPVTAGSGLVGCCTYPVGDLRMTWCYYDAALYAGRESVCRSTTFNGDPAVWTTTVPIPYFAAIR